MNDVILEMGSGAFAPRFSHSQFSFLSRAAGCSH